MAVVDSGVNIGGHDFTDASGTTRRIVAQVKLNSNTNRMSDGYGHRTHVAGIVGGNGSNSNGAYVGIAPQVNLINVKVSDDNGGASISDVVNGLQWVYNNRAAYNIRVVNLSLNSTVKARLIATAQPLGTAATTGVSAPGTGAGEVDVAAASDYWGGRSKTSGAGVNTRWGAMQ